MKSIATLAAEEKVGKKRKKGGDGASSALFTRAWLIT